MKSLLGNFAGVVVRGVGVWVGDVASVVLGIFAGVALVRGVGMWFLLRIYCWGFLLGSYLKSLLRMFIGIVNETVAGDTCWDRG